MEDALCIICFKEYDETDVVPRVLECGHSVCSECISQIIQTSKCCPKCRTKMTQSSSVNYVINYSLLGIADSLKNSSNQQTVSQLRVKNLKKQMVIMETKFAKSKLAVDDNLRLVTDGLTELQELSDKTKDDDDNIDLEEANKTLVGLTAKLDTISCNSAVASSNQLNLVDLVDVKLADFANTQMFLLEIYHGLLRDKFFYAITNIADQIKYGKITFQDDELFIHAFSSTRFRKEAQIVLFQDIKLCLPKTKFDAFLDVVCNKEIIRRIKIKLLNTILTPYFVRFCTGENGSGYKGSPFIKGQDCYEVDYDFKLRRNVGNISDSIINVSRPLISDEEASKCMKYSWLKSTEDCVNKPGTYLSMNFNASFSIQNYSQYETQSQNFVGKIEEPTDLANFITYGKENKIFDSGIAIPITR